MTGYAKVPYQLFDDLQVGKINNKQFNILSWLHRRADYKTGVCRQVSAIRILAEMWGDDREQERPTDRTIQEHLKRLALMRYLISHHKQGSRGSYKVTLTNFEVTVRDDDGVAVSEEVLNQTETKSWEEYKETLCGEPSAESSGDVAVNLPVTPRSCFGEPSGDASPIHEPQEPQEPKEPVTSGASFMDGSVDGSFESESVAPASLVPERLPVPESQSDLPDSATPKTESTDSERAAQKLWQLLDRPKSAKMSDWASAMKDLMSDAEMNLDEFKEFLIWVCTVNSVKYIRKAKDPTAFLGRNLDNLLKYYRADKAVAKSETRKPENLSENKPASSRDLEFLRRLGVQI